MQFDLTGERPMTETTDIFEVMSTMRAMRRLKPDPVPDEVIRKILLAGQAAANGGNTQRWRFLVLKNHPGKKVVQGYYKKLFDEVVGPRYRNSAPPPDRISRSNYGKWRPINI
jgi:nitroreductase